MEIETLLSSPDFKKMEITNIIEKSLDLFEEASSQNIGNLLEKIKIVNTKLTELHSQLSEHVCGGEESDGIPTEKDENIFIEMVGCYPEQRLLNEHLKALFEMKVVYLFKTVEITIKSLIKTADPKIDTRDFYKWKDMEDYFIKNIDIKISTIDGYKELTELKDINNNIKHDETIKNDIKKIKEFANESQFIVNQFNNSYIF